MKFSLRFVAILLVAVSSCAFAAEKAKPIKALLVTGGGSHDYEAQKKTLVEGLRARVNVDLTVVHEGDNRDHRMSIYEKADWAKGYDVIVHNECFGTVADKDFVERIAAPHKAGLPAVVLHATMHSYRNAPTDAWREVIGVRSMSHEKRRDLVVKTLDPEHPIMRGFPVEWSNPSDELYKIEKAWPYLIPLAQAYGQDTKQDHPVIWVNTVGRARVFATTLGHLDATMKTDVYLDLVARGLLWACGKLDGQGKPRAGYGPGGK